MSKYPIVSITLNQDTANEPVYKMLGCPTEAINLSVVIPKGVHYKPYLDLSGFAKGTCIDVVIHGELGEPQEDKNMIPFCDAAF